MKDRSTKRRRNNYQGSLGHEFKKSSCTPHNSSANVSGTQEIGNSTPRVQCNNLTSLLDRSVARSGLSYEGFVRHITKGALGTLKIWSESDLERLLLTCERLGLDPLGKEVYCTESQDFSASESFHAKPPLVVVGLDGWCRIINSHPQFDGMSFVESAQSVDGMPIWIECSIYRKDRRVATTVREYMCECKTEQSAWLTHPRRMLRHKALTQCARLCFGLTGIYDPDEAQRVQAAQSLQPNRSLSEGSEARGMAERKDGQTITSNMRPSHMMTSQPSGQENIFCSQAKQTSAHPKGGDQVKKWIYKKFAE